VSLEPGAVEPLLRGRLGRPYLWSAECSSTQDVLRDSALPEGAVAAAEHQSAGRGRAGRAWVDVPGASLLVSVLLRPAAPPARLPELSLVAGLAVAEAIDSVTGLRCLLKWPNDVVHDGRKVAGILLEVADGAVVCGIGVNVNQDEGELPPAGWGPSSSLRVATGRRQDRALLLAELLARLEARYDEWLAGGLGAVVGAVSERDWLRGRQVRAGTGAGVADGIAEDGRLRVLIDGVPSLVESGDVTPDPDETPATPASPR
jgi:BirA family biotin operon repressor/biotin-[acetyl-CoA-carboxylase] ligase